LPTRIGINTGMVVGVTIGAADRMTYTLLGDVVNVAARAEQLNKHYGTQILATESTVREAGSGFVSRCLGAATLPGRDGDVVVYSVEGP
jgi:class 3 adenylate cyclase